MNGGPRNGMERPASERGCDLAEAYRQARRLRQAQDDRWVRSAVPYRSRSLLDAGCGTGEFLRETLLRRPGIRRAVGLDASPANLEVATRALAGLRPLPELKHGDLLRCQPIGRPFDVIVMMSVLHWLHPDENRVFAWAAAGLKPAGRLVLTTYHPEHDRDGFGGTDSVVREALSMLGMEPAEVSTRFRSAGIVPIAARTLPASRVRPLLHRHFAVVETDVREAVMRVDGEAAYRAYHRGTFGSYYARMMPGQQQIFYRQLGRAAMVRMRDQGHVTKMAVRRWICSTPGTTR